MSEFLTNAWGILLQIYTLIYQAGYPGCLIAFALGAYMSRKGVRITGQPEGYSGTIGPGGRVDIRKDEAIIGSARTKLDLLFGLLLKLAGTVLVFSAIFAFVNITLG